MVELNEDRVASVSGGFVIVIPFAVKAATAAFGFAGSAFGAYQAGKVIGSDIIQGINNNQQ